TPQLIYINDVTKSLRASVTSPRRLCRPKPFQGLRTFEGFAKCKTLRKASGALGVMQKNEIDSQQNQTKREYLNEWINAVNNHGGFGKWHWDVSFHPSDIEGLIKKCMDKELA